MRRRTTSLRSILPDKTRLAALAPYGGVALAAIAVGAFALLVPLPAWQALEAQGAEVATARQEVEDQEITLRMMQDGLQKELDHAQEEVAAARSLLMNQQQVTESLDRLYRQADQAGVQVQDVRGQPAPQDDADAAYQLRTLRLRATGSVPALLSLVAEIQSLAPTQGLLLENLQVNEAAGGAALLVDLVFHVAPEPDAGEAEQPDASPTPTTAQEATPVATPSPAPEATLAPDLLVRPPDWPADWPWPPEGQGQEQGGAPRTHMVVDGDTLFSLAVRYGVTVEAIKAANGLSLDLIYVGQELVIP